MKLKFIKLLSLILTLNSLNIICSIAADVDPEELPALEKVKSIKLQDAFEIYKNYIEKGMPARYTTRAGRAQGFADPHNLIKAFVDEASLKKVKKGLEEFAKQLQDIGTTDAKIKSKWKKIAKDYGEILNQWNEIYRAGLNSPHEDFRNMFYDENSPNNIIKSGELITQTTELFNYINQQFSK